MHQLVGTIPGVSMREAAEIVAGECSLLTLPLLSDHGLSRTLALLPFQVDIGPRAWQLTSRPQLATRRAWDRLESDLDICEEIWGSADVVTQIVGPWTLAASLELPNGHRAITDPGALRDIREGLAFGVVEHVDKLRKRFGGEVFVQLDEPLLAAVHRGSLPGTTQWETIPPVALPDLEQGLIDAHFLHLYDPLWPSHARALFVDRELIRGTENLDGFGEAVVAGARFGLGISVSGDPRDAAIDLAHLWDELRLDRLMLTEATIYPNSLRNPAAALRFSRQVSEILVKDVGDL